MMPTPTPTSTAPAITACWVSPAPCVYRSSSVRPCFLKIPPRWPTSDMPVSHRPRCPTASFSVSWADTEPIIAASAKHVEASRAAIVFIPSSSLSCFHFWACSQALFFASLRILSIVRAVFHPRQGALAPQAASGLPALRVPIALEIGDQGRAEVAVGLLARIDREIRSEGVERLLRHPEGAPVARRAHHAGTGEPLDHPFDRRVHRAGLDDLIADQPA